ncbi:MAG: hypothetical protein RL094_105 [Candidatus Parcubacteria bacterium]
MVAITHIGSPQMMLLLTFFLVVFMWHHKKPHHLFQFALFMILGAVSVYLLKIAFKIPRPAGGLITEYGYGFPSGHAAMATLFFLLVIYTYRTHFEQAIARFLFVTGSLALIGIISYSRIYLGVHTPTDVIGGMCIGTLWFVFSIWFYKWLLKAYPNLGSSLGEETIK